VFNVEAEGAPAEVRNVLVEFRVLYLPGWPVGESTTSKGIIVPSVELHGFGSGEGLGGIHVLEHAHNLINNLLVGEKLDTFTLVSL